MEGVASEAASLAGHLKLGKLVCIYDDNKISIDETSLRTGYTADPICFTNSNGPIDGDIKCTFTEDVQKRFEAHNWHVGSRGKRR